MWLFTYLKHTLELSKLYWCSDHPSGWELSCVLQQLERKCSFQPVGHNLTWALGQFKFPIWSNSQLIDWDVSCTCSLITFHQISNRSSHLSLNARVHTEEQGGSSPPDPKQSQQCNQTEPENNEGGKHVGLVCLRQPCSSFSFLKGRGAAEAQHQLLCEDLLFASSGSSAHSQMEILRGLYTVRLLGACCGLTPGHKGQFSTTAWEGNENSWVKLLELLRLGRREWQ